MGLYSGIHQVVRFKNGDLQHFFEKKDKGIHFRRLGSNGTWENSIELLSNTQEDFSLNIDAKDHLHMLCQLNTGEILYMKYDGKLWDRQVLSKFEPSRYIIKHPVVLTIGNHIHILFAVGTTFNTGLWSLYHYYWDENRWNSAEITKFTAGQRLSPFYMDCTDRHIHLVYRALAGSRYQIFYCRYHIEHSIWSIPENATHSETDCGMPTLLVKNQTLHLVWISLHKNDLSVKYCNKTIPSSKAAWSHGMDLSALGAGCTYPQLIWLEDRLWCIWCQGEALYGCRSEDDGRTWSPPMSLEFEKGEHFYLLSYSTNDESEKRIFKVQRILGNLDISLHLPVLQAFMDLPVYTPATAPSPWEQISKQPSVPFKFPSLKEMNSPPPSRSSHPTATAPASAMPSPARHNNSLKPFEQVLLDEIERQEEHCYTIISKLEDHLIYHEELTQDFKDIKILCHEVKERLHTLHKDMEQIKQEIDQMKRKGFLKRIFTHVDK